AARGFSFQRPSHRKSLIVDRLGPGGPKASGLWSLAFGFWLLASGLWSLVSGLWPLARYDHFVHIAVVGAGVIGCAVAYECASRGADVSVFERRGVARGASWASAGVLAPWIEVHERGSLLDICAESLAMYDAFVERVRSEGVPTFEYARTGTLEAA